jgi:16S rRNA (cytidine1402-2'-O)-methyltransferase
MVVAAISAGQIVTPIPGPSAVTALVSIAAVPGGRFVFDGFPPRGRTDRRKFFARLRTEPRAVVLYESPRRISDTLHELQETLGARNVLIGRELTKRFEEVYRGTLDCAAEWVSSRLCGEFSLLIYPASGMSAQTDEPCNDLDAVVLAALEAGQSPSDAVKAAIAATGIGRREVYARMLQLRRAARPAG